jgi:GWxTD domain-containing protein
MAGPARARRAIASLLPLLCGVLWLACSSAVRPQAAAAVAEWAEGPARWLILPDEEKRLSRIRTNQEAVAFMEAFWHRRDPDPERPGNPFVQVFYQRVEAADRLYGEPGVRGSLTDRGRALVLLGPPPILGYGQRPAATWEPGRVGGRPLAETRKAKVETWTYQAPDLSPALVALLKAEDREAKVTLTFVVEPHGTSLIEGGKLLDLAARAAVRDSGRP